MDFSDFDVRDIEVWNHRGYDEPLCWRFTSREDYTVNPMKSLYRGQDSRYKREVNHYATLNGKQQLIGVYGYRDRYDKRIVSAGFIVSQRVKN